MDGTIKTVVFDLDGTLYQNNSFHRDYVYFLLEGTGRTAWAEPLIAYIEGVYRGEGLVMNACYRTDAVVADGLDDFLRRLEAARLPDMDYETALARTDCIYLGDAWAVLTFIGCALGLGDRAVLDRVYRQTRVKMSRDGVVGNPHLRGVIARLGASHATVLLTNSYEETAADFLRQLGYEGVFHRVIYGAGKPRDMAKNLRAYYPELATDPGSFLSVGDHAFNDLMPLQRLGCKALWINPFWGIREPACDWSVHTLEELADCLARMCP